MISLLVLECEQAMLDPLVFEHVVPSCKSLTGPFAGLYAAKISRLPTILTLMGTEMSVKILFPVSACELTALVWAGKGFLVSLAMFTEETKSAGVVRHMDGCAYLS